MNYEFVEAKEGVFFVYTMNNAYLFKTTNGVNWTPLGMLNDPMGNEIEKKIANNQGVRKVKDWVLIEKDKFTELLNGFQPELVQELKERFKID